MNEMAASTSGATPNSFLFPAFTQANVRNYSDMMRSLAAKYNGTEDAASQRRDYINPTRKNEASNTFGEVSNNHQQPPKERVSYPEPSTSASPPSLLNSLPFRAGMIPGIMDMSSTQLLITLVSF